MASVEFEPWPKIARLNRDITVTEKIDGTNAAIVVVPWAELVEETSQGWNWSEGYYREWGRQKEFLLGIAGEPVDREFNGSTWTDYFTDAHAVFAQSRKQLLSVEKDNFGFAKWVATNADALVRRLGPGRHFGEWWGQGIQRRYGLDHKRFSLFNTRRHGDIGVVGLDGGMLTVVPKLYEGPYADFDADWALKRLRAVGSLAAPGFMNPEGFILFHQAAGEMFKVTLEGDEAPKSLVA